MVRGRPVRTVAGPEYPLRIGQWQKDKEVVGSLRRRENAADASAFVRQAGKRDLLLEVTPSDRAGATGRGNALVTPDGKSYAYSLHQQLSELQLVEGLK